MQEILETRIWSLGWEEPIKEGMAAHSSVLAQRIPWTEKPGRLWSIRSQRDRHNWSDFTCMHLFKTLPRYGHIRGKGFRKLIWVKRKWKCCSFVSDSLRPHWLQPARLLRSWDSPGKSTGAGGHFLLQCEIFIQKEKTRKVGGEQIRRYSVGNRSHEMYGQSPSFRKKILPA